MQEILLKILGFSVAGIISGVLLIAIFNRIPPSWLTEYGQTPSEEVRSRERLKWIPYAPVLAIGFGLVYAKLAYFDIYYALPAMITIWLLVFIAIGDFKYMIVVDEAVILLLASCIGFYGQHEGIANIFYGALTGGGFLLLISVIGRLITKTETLGFGDVKVAAALGAVLGFDGIVVVLVSAFLMAGVFAACVLIKNKNAKESYIPLVPFISLAGVIYMVAFWGEIVIKDLL